MKEAEQARRGSSPDTVEIDAAPLRAVIDAAPNAVFMTNAAGYIQLANAQTGLLFGYSQIELQNMKAERLIPEYHSATETGTHSDFFSKPDSQSHAAGQDLYGLRHDGSKVPIEVGIQQLETKNGTCTLASVVDISERKHAEEHFRLMVEAAPYAMLIVDSSGEIALINREVENLFGYAREELVGRPIETLVPRRARRMHPRLRDGFFAAPQARSMGMGRDLHAVTKQGREIPVEVQLNPITTSQGTATVASIIDITERKRVERLYRQEQNHQLRQSILDSIPFSVIAVDLGGDITTTNPATERMLGYRRSEMVGKNAAELLHVPEELERHAQYMTKELGIPVPADHNAIIAKARKGMRDESEWTYCRKNFERIPVQVSITPLHDEDGKLTGFLNVAYDISDRKRAEAVILRMAQHDALTGLPNRALLMDRLDMVIKQAHKHGEMVGVMVLDLDHFKRINDSLGHHVGDELLIAISRRLQHGLREGDTLARLGGDEFVIVLPEIESRQSMQGALHRIVKQIATPVKLDEQELMVTPSIGGAIYPHDGKDSQTLIKNADAAMYAAKAGGRNNAQWFNEEMLRQNKQKLQLTSALKPALESDQFQLVYQPEVCLNTGRIIGLEALIRWQHPTLGAIPPDQFIPLAEETGMILNIGEWVLRTACREISQLNTTLNYPLQVAVNVSPRQLQQVDWILQIMQSLKESDLPGSGLELEITEGMLIQNPTESAELLHEVRRMGVSVVIDDFGTGYSSLSYLTRFPIDKLKIDRGFVRDVTVDPSDAAIVDAIIAMSHSLGLTVVAEGVETKEQLKYLHQRLCNQAQGYYFSPGVTVQEIPGILGQIEKQLADIRHASPAL